MSLVNRYQDQARTLLGEWQKKLPAAERAGSLRNLKQDPAMAALGRPLHSLSAGWNRQMTQSDKEAGH